MRAWLVNALRGICMGIADVIPGVSGGTLALILGIYPRFIAGVSAIGPSMVKSLLQGRFWGAMSRGLRDPDALTDEPVERDAGHILFLGSLAVGIGTAILTGARYIPDLLDRYPAQMKGFFFGLVLASVVVPFRQMERRTGIHVLAMLAALAGTWFMLGTPASGSGQSRGEVALAFDPPTTEAMTLGAASVTFLTNTHGGEQDKREVSFGPTQDIQIPAGSATHRLKVVSRMPGESANLEPNMVVRGTGLPDNTTVTGASAMAGGVDPSMLFVFMAGVIAISAMVLPGISGSFILLLLGLYHFMTYQLRAVVYDQDMSALPFVVIFCCALAVGIMGFSRVLNRLLKSHHDVTMAALVGLMIGSLRKLWPFTSVGEGGIERNVMPATIDGTVGVTILTLVVGAALVTLLERWGRSLPAEQAEGSPTDEPDSQGGQ